MANSLSGLSVSVLKRSMSASPEKVEEESISSSRSTSNQLVKDVVSESTDIHSSGLARSVNVDASVAISGIGASIIISGAGVSIIVSGLGMSIIISGVSSVGA